MSFGVGQQVSLSDILIPERLRYKDARPFFELGYWSDGQCLVLLLRAVRRGNLRRVVCLTFEPASEVLGKRSLSPSTHNL